MFFKKNEKKECSVNDIVNIIKKIKHDLHHLDYFDYVKTIQQHHIKNNNYISLVVGSSLAWIITDAWLLYNTMFKKTDFTLMILSALVSNLLIPGAGIVTPLYLKSQNKPIEVLFMNKIISDYNKYANNHKPIDPSIFSSFWDGCNTDSFFDVIKEIDEMFETLIEEFSKNEVNYSEAKEGWSKLIEELQIDFSGNSNKITLNNN